MEFVLDVAKWRCGRDGDHALGEGATRLLNPKGYMCCLGQIALQCMNATEADIDHRSDPESLFVVGGGFIDVGDSVLTKPVSKEGDEDWMGRTFHRTNSPLSIQAMNVNDNPDIDNKTRVDTLITIFENHGHTLTVINDHLL